MALECSHLQQVDKPRTQGVEPSAHGCQECLKMGDDWVHLRLCLTCGHVGCCDSSRNRHATRHYHETHHPVIKSFEPGEDWAWCYVDQLAVDQIPALPQESAPVHYESPNA